MRIRRLRAKLNPVPALPELTLLVRFTIVSALITVAFALALGWFVGKLVERATLEEAAATTIQAADSLLAPYLVRGDLIYPLWPARLQALDRLLRPHISDSGIARVRLWSRDGVVVYSTDRKLVGKQGAVSEELRTALAGKAAIRVGPLEKTSQANKAGQLLAVYVPVRLPETLQPEGVYEVNIAADPLFARIRDVRVRVWFLICFGITVLYGSLFGLVRRASKGLITQQHTLRAAFEGAVRALAATIGAKDAGTGDHSSQVAKLAEAVARTLGLPEEDVHIVRMAGYLHDLGKVGIPDRLLRKTGALSKSERTTIQNHTLIGYSILEPLPIDERVKLAVRHNHERWNGSGYPDGQAGKEIPIHARILAVVDAYEAMTSARPYRGAMKRSEAVEQLLRNAGIQFDPDLVRAFLLVLGIPAPEEMTAQHLARLDHQPLAS